MNKLTDIPSTSSVPSVKTSLVKLEIWPVIWEIPLPSQDILTVFQNLYTVIFHLVGRKGYTSHRIFGKQRKSSTGIVKPPHLHFPWFLIRCGHAYCIYYVMPQEGDSSLKLWRHQQDFTAISASSYFSAISLIFTQ